MLMLRTLFILFVVGLFNSGVSQEMKMDHSQMDHSETNHDMMAVESEFDFLVGMIPHHQEAIGSADALLALTERPELRELLRDIITVQTFEVALMEMWLETHYPGQDTTVSYMPMMRSTPGLTLEDAEQEFLTDMITHHQMAVVMSQELLEMGAEHPAISRYAASIIDGQSREIALMQSFLEEWYTSK